MSLIAEWLTDSMASERPPLVGDFSSNFCAWRVSEQRIPTAVNLDFIDRNRYISLIELFSYTHEAEWTPFQTQYFSEYL
jgi:hypothetical protein